MNAVNIAIGHQIHIRRKELGLALEQLSARTQVPVDRIKRHEAGERRATAAEIDRYTRALHVDVRFLFASLSQGRTPNPGDPRDHRRGEDLIRHRLKQWLAEPNAHSSA